MATAHLSKAPPPPLTRAAISRFGLSTERRRRPPPPKAIAKPAAPPAPKRAELRPPSRGPPALAEPSVSLKGRPRALDAGLTQVGVTICVPQRFAATAMAVAGHGLAAGRPNLLDSDGALTHTARAYWQK